MTPFQHFLEAPDTGAVHVRILRVQKRSSQQARCKQRLIIDETELVAKRVAAVEAPLAPWLSLDLPVNHAAGGRPYTGESVVKIGNR